METKKRSYTKHGHGVGGRKSPTYSSWTHMYRRCHVPTDYNYWKYGARGICVCERWHDFTNFLVDMGERPAGMSIDRIDGSLGYSPENCRWATQAEQIQNTKRTVLDIPTAREIKSLMGLGLNSVQVAKEYGIGSKLVRDIWNGVTWRNA